MVTFANVMKMMLIVNIVGKLIYLFLNATFIYRLLLNKGYKLQTCKGAKIEKNSFHENDLLYLVHIEYEF